jgi:excinuclease ABC subunit C
MSNLRFGTSEINELPVKPGVYKYYNDENQIIYVGKAKNLKKRVQSYFTKQTGLNWKTRRMVSEIKGIEVVIVNSEADAFHLENNLIKTLQPKYNIRLKDDKSYPYICITNERFPRIISTRRLNPKSGKYFGPYSSVKAMNNVLRLINSLYQLRTCKYDLSEENIAKKKYKVCLEYHIKNCKGPCEGLQQEEEYNRDIEQAISILKGKTTIVKDFFRNQMNRHSNQLEFESAEKYRNRMDLLEKYRSKSQVVNPQLGTLDVFTAKGTDNQVYVNYLQVVGGSINQTYSLEIKNPLKEDLHSIFYQSIPIIATKFNSEANEILTNIEIDYLPIYKTQHVPQIGDKKKLLNLSYKNLLFYERELLEQKTRKKDNKVLLQLQKDLSLKSIPLVIECFDNSNLQGSNPVASMVQFKNGKPHKSGYRKFNIKTVVGPDDFSSMHEIVTRRYKRLLEENVAFPQLIVIDGGKGQLNAAVLALKEIGGYSKTTVVGIAKRLEEIYFPGDSEALHIDKKSPGLRLLQQLRDEAHRFAITFHRQKRSKHSMTSWIDSIKGIGPKTKMQLLSRYKTVSGIKDARKEDLVKLIGQSKAELLLKAIKKG